MGQVDAVLTPVSPSQAAGAFQRSYVAVTGHAPYADTSWAIPMAQSAFETGNWAKMFNYNTGNVTSTGAGDWVYQYPGSLRFAAYAGLDDGAAAQLRVLKRMNALAAADAGDINSFVDALRAGNYIGHDEKAYAALRASLPSLVAKYRGVTPAPPPSTGLPPLARAAIVVALGAGIAGSIYYVKHGRLPLPTGLRRRWV